MPPPSDDPFATPVDQRDPARQLRGRIASPVTVWTTYGEDDAPHGITVGSVFVIEQPAAIVGLIDPLSLFWTALSATERFVVHVLERTHRRLADQMAGRYPGPDARFENVEIERSEWGPVIAGVETRAYCDVAGIIESGDSMLVRGAIASVELSPLTDPLLYFRGEYHEVRPRTR